MRPRSFLSGIVLFVSVGPFATRADAQMIPIQDHRLNYSTATYQGVRDSGTAIPPTPFGYWNNIRASVAEKYVTCVDSPPDLCLVGSAYSMAFQISQFFPGGLQFSGGASGSWGVPPDGDYSWVSNAGFTFRVDQTFQYHLFADIDQGDWPSQGLTGGAVRVSEGAWPGTTILNHEFGVLDQTGRLGPGTYTVEGFSSGGMDLESFQGTVYSAQWTIQQVPDPIIDPFKGQPADHWLPCGGVAVFSVATAGPQGNYTYQWRRNGVPLVNGGHVSGATTGTLTITSACFADAGDYDVVVTGVPPGGGSPPGTPVAEPSRLAHLGILTTVTGIETDPISEPPTAPMVREAAPNPFSEMTSVRYEASRPARVRATVYNVAGAKVRTVTDKMTSGSGTVTWDGRLRSGAPAPVGIYFIEVEVGGLRETRKVVLAK